MWFAGAVATSEEPWTVVRGFLVVKFVEIVRGVKQWEVWRGWRDKSVLEGLSERHELFLWAT